jgi:16S rRNA (guanine966-N2)-methyltransferase
MRIVGGTYRSRLLKTPKDDSIRPTSDKVRLAVFNMLRSRQAIDDAYVLDAFCGTGALGLEALSQGASYCHFWDKSPTSLALCTDNINALNVREQATTRLVNTPRVDQNPNPEKPFTLVFLDPPYRKGLVDKALFALHTGGWVNTQTVCVIEISADEKIETPLTVIQEKIYGDTKILLAHIGNA